MCVTVHKASLAGHASQDKELCSRKCSKANVIWCGALQQILVAQRGIVIWQILSCLGYFTFLRVELVEWLWCEADPFGSARHAESTHCHGSKVFFGLLKVTWSLAVSVSLSSSFWKTTSESKRNLKVGSAEKGQMILAKVGQGIGTVCWKPVAKRGHQGQWGLAGLEQRGLLAGGSQLGRGLRWEFVLENRQWREAVGHRTMFSGKNYFSQDKPPSGQWQINEQASIGYVKKMDRLSEPGPTKMVVVWKRYSRWGVGTDWNCERIKLQTWVLQDGNC